MTADNATRTEPGDDYEAIKEELQREKKNGPAQKKQSQLEADLGAAWNNFTADQLRRDPPPPRYVWEPRIPAGKVVLLCATGGSYKTTLLTLLAACRATGKKFIDGTLPSSGETVVFTLEDRAEDYWRKLAALRLEWGDDFNADLIAKRFHVIDAVGLLNMKMVAGQFGQFMVTDLPDALANVIKARAPACDLVIIETTSRVGAGETNDALAALISAAERLALLTGAAIVLVAHVSQEAARSGERGQHASRGGTAAPDNARGVLNLSALTEDDAKKLIPDAELNDGDRERLLVFSHSKGWTSGPVALPVVFERHHNAMGPVLRRANLSAHRLSQAERFELLRSLVLRLTAEGIAVTATRLRDYTDDLRTSKAKLGRFLTEAEAAKVIRTAKREGKGGGTVITACPTPVRTDKTQPADAGDEDKPATERSREE